MGGCHIIYFLLFQFRPLPPEEAPDVNVIPILPLEGSIDNHETSISTEACVEAGGSLLEGWYDEQTSAQSFQDALTEWRNGRNKVAMESKGKCDLFLHFENSSCPVEQSVVTHFYVSVESNY